MAVGDKVIFPIFTTFIAALNMNCRQHGCLPDIGTVVLESGSDVTVVWPSGEAVTIPDSVVLKVFDIEDFADEAATSWRNDVGKWVQISEYPTAGIKALVKSEGGVDLPPQSPAASGQVELVLGVGFIGDEGPGAIVAWIGCQDGKKHIAVLGLPEGPPGTTPFQKPYGEQPGRRAVGFG
jgi:hypothetical protein